MASALEGLISCHMLMSVQYDTFLSLTNAFNDTDEHISNNEKALSESNSDSNEQSPTLIGKYQLL